MKSLMYPAPGKAAQLCHFLRLRVLRLCYGTSCEKHGKGVATATTIKHRMTIATFKQQAFTPVSTCSLLSARITETLNTFENSRETLYDGAKVYTATTSC